MPGTCTVLSSRMRFAIAWLTTSTSSAAVRPPATRLHSVWATTPRTTSASTLRTCDCWSAGNWSTIRSTALTAVFVWRVAKTRWPVLAASRTSAIVSASRISPTRMMSGSSRSAARRPRANERAWPPISRWVTRHCCVWCTNSIGSSIVTMWAWRVLLTRSIIAARVVDLPEPVGPVTRIRPFGISHRSAITAGRPSCSNVRILLGICRSAAPKPWASR